MNRILLIGSPGAGKTTLAKALSQQLQLPLVHLDKLFWRGDWEQVPRDAFDVALQVELEKPCWIIDGNYIRTLAHRLEYSDTVIWLDFATSVCLWGITKRIVQHYGKIREDMGGQCVERLDKERFEFYRYVATFNRRYRGKIHVLLNDAPHIKCIRCKNRRQLNAYLRSLENNHDL